LAEEVDKVFGLREVDKVFGLRVYFRVSRLGFRCCLKRRRAQRREAVKSKRLCSHYLHAPSFCQEECRA